MAQRQSVGRRSPITPQFTFDEATGRYRGPNGRFVPRTTVRSAVDQYIDNKASQVRVLAEQLRGRTISFPAWQKQMETEIAKVHLANAAAAKGGWDRMTQSDYGRVGQLVKQELRGLKDVHGGLRGLAKEIEGGLPLDGRFINRIQQYMQAGRHTYHVVDRLEAQASGMDEERSILHARDSCEGCVEAEAQGWQPIGTLPLPGERDCLRNCRCTMEYRSSGKNERVASVPSPPGESGEESKQSLSGMTNNPQGQNIADTLQNEAKGERKAKIQAAIDAVAQVHGVDKMPRIPIKIDNLRDESGGFEYDRQTRKPELIVIDRKDALMELTTVHEIGHFVDLSGLGTVGRFSSESESTLAEWRQVVDKSNAVIRLRDTLAKGYALSTENNRKNVPILKQHFEYLLDHKELFARSYAQYIATRSGSALLNEQLQKVGRGVYADRMWNEEDFKPVAEVFDKILRERGWIK